MRRLIFILGICLSSCSLGHKEQIINGHNYFKTGSTIIHDPDCKKCDSIQNAKLDKLVNSLKIGDE
jgi:hypothetical protein